MRRLIHYSKTPLTKVRSTRHNDQSVGAYKTPGLWISVEGDDDWLNWCKGENWNLDSIVHATEIVLSKEADVRTIGGASQLDAFTAEFSLKNVLAWDRGLDWPAIRSRWQGLIIAPYCWERRLSQHTHWYYGWDCASGVIWDAKAVKEVRAIEPPDLTEKYEETIGERI